MNDTSKVLAGIDINGKQDKTPAQVVSACFINLHDTMRRRHPDASYRLRVTHRDDSWSIEAVADGID